ncbi:MAG: energy transducer TonB [Pyrinomonadaceae bacterium]
MTTHRSRDTSLLLQFAWACILVLSSASANGQQAPASVSARERGIQLYQQGDANGAIELFREALRNDKNDGDAWHYLGLTFLLKAEKDEARKAFEKAAAIRLDNLTAPLSEIPKSLAKRYANAAESLGEYIELSSNPSSDLTYDLESLRWYRDFYGGASQETVMAARDVSTKLRILEKPFPDFSGTRATGTCVLRGVFAADRTVRHLLVLKKVEPQFDRACVEAAKRIRFEPAIKDGRPVSVFLQVEHRRIFF